MPDLPPSTTVAITIHRSASEVYDFASEPSSFAEWASGLGTELTPNGDHWLAAGPDGPIQVRFSPPNLYGVLDHWVRLASGDEFYIPLRVIARGNEAEVMLTLLREPGTSDERHEADAAWVARDLWTLKTLLEG
jgi:hypothetical protein